MIANYFRTSIQYFCPASLHICPRSSEHARAQYRMRGCASTPSSSTSAGLAKLPNRTERITTAPVIVYHHARLTGPHVPAHTATLRGECAEARHIAVLRMLGIWDVHVHGVGRKAKILGCSLSDKLLDRNDGDVQWAAGQLREQWRESDHGALYAATPRNICSSGFRIAALPTSHFPRPHAISALSFMEGPLDTMAQFPPSVQDRERWRPSHPPRCTPSSPLPREMQCREWEDHAPRRAHLAQATHCPSRECTVNLSTGNTRPGPCALRGGPVSARFERD
ncbi:hypothetical protein FIBSPDRAFT_289831 [Athelia psychrophila]|uniref:Uncharacterized protein n=1 Tax=Athelia psychrophila TaxID=1759441 RepID=A0A167XK29_9AGAM|nr:hypothetical protein FIBSPDRAFT_289831 [Fibularhizoctonia sp. CBS 109695]